MSKNILGINGLGRIGKLTLWNQVLTDYFDGYVVNLGRRAGKTLSDLVYILTHDSTYGSIHSFLFGRSGRQADIRFADSKEPEIFIEGKRIRILTESRNPAEIPWKREGVRLVIDCTGKFLDPGVPESSPAGSIRGHFAGGAERVIISAPYKIQGTTAPSDSTMLVYGINHLNYRPDTHRIISAASCTTTALSHMLKPLLEEDTTRRILTASMSTVHAATNTQNMLDSVPRPGTEDTRKNRSALNNIIITSTGAAKALEQVLPQVSSIGFMADSVRIPTTSVSLISLNITFRTPTDHSGGAGLTGAHINDIYRRAAEGAGRGCLVYSDEQHVSSDILGYEASVVIEGERTHCRTGCIEIPAEDITSRGISADKPLRLNVTHSKIFGWYDNEYGCYVATLGKLLRYVDQVS